MYVFSMVERIYHLARSGSLVYVEAVSLRLEGDEINGDLKFDVD